MTGSFIATIDSQYGIAEILSWTEDNDDWLLPTWLATNINGLLPAWTNEYVFIEVTC